MKPCYSFFVNMVYNIAHQLATFVGTSERRLDMQLGDVIGAMDEKDSKSCFMSTMSHEDSLSNIKYDLEIRFIILKSDSS